MKRALIDLSSVIWTCLRAGKDPENGIKVTDPEGKETLVNSADFGYQNAMNHLTTVMKELSLHPYQMLFVLEGMNSKIIRQGLLPSYKVGRDKVPEWYEQFNLCKQSILDQFLALGSSVVTQDGVEADDVIGYLSEKLRGEVWIVTNDKDLAVCMNERVHLYRMGMKDQNPFGPFNPKYIPVCIALVGDASDNIPGAKGFGPKAFENLLTIFGDDGLEMMEGLIKSKSLGTLAEDVGEFKPLQKIIDSAGSVYTSYELARLHTNRINTVQSALQWQVGMVKPRGPGTDSMLRAHAGVTRLVSAENYAEALEFLQRHVKYTPFFALDIETSTPPESDEWLERQDKEDKVVDVFGSELTGMSITFGANLQYTYYITHEHVQKPGCTNLSLAQVRDMVDAIPREKVTWVHNAQFELPVLYQEWGEDWKEDPEYHGFLRNVRDSRIAAHYVNENEKTGLKALSTRLLQYEQVSYQEVTTHEYEIEEWKALGSTGKELGRYHLDAEGAQCEADDAVQTMIKVQHKMNELTADQVVGYGADDSICTAALANHFMMVMEIEDTIDAFEEVETWPAYLTALAYVQGIDFSLEDMAVMVKEDDEAYDKAWATLRSYLMEVGFEGTTCPVIDKLEAADIKLAFNVITGQELKTQVRTQSKLAKLLEQAADDMDAAGVESGRTRAFALLVSNNDVAGVNRMMQDYFSGEPDIDLASPKKMQALLYDTMELPINIVNKVTPVEKQKNPDLANALYKFGRKRMGKPAELTDADYVLLRKKAKTDDTAIDYAMAFDADLISPEQRKALKAVQIMKKVMTRRSLFYKNYWGAKHWKDGKIHPSINQCGAVTRRYSSSGPNVQQWPKKGEAVRFRGCVKPHHKDAVIASIDYTGQELRLAAERSQDKNMLACYIGDQLKDIHSITAAGAMRLKWGDDKVDALCAKYGADLPVGLTKTEFEYRVFLKLRAVGKADPVGKLADDLRKDSKNVNFAAQFGGQAAKLSETLIMRLEDAQLFLDARSEMFPDVDEAAKRAERFAEENGYALTMMGARRHLREGIMSDDRGERSRAARQAWNMEIQGSAGEMTKIGMGRLWKSGALFKYDARFIAPVHDELVTSVHRDHAVEFLKIKHQCMTGPYADMKVPILGSISFGPDFAKQHEAGDTFDEKAILEILQQMQESNELSSRNEVRETLSS